MRNPSPTAAVASITSVEGSGVWYTPKLELADAPEPTVTSAAGAMVSPVAGLLILISVTCQEGSSIAPVVEPIVAEALVNVTLPKAGNGSIAPANFGASTIHSADDLNAEEFV